MFGSFAFGQGYFGQAYGEGDIPETVVVAPFAGSLVVVRHRTRIAVVPREPLAAADRKPRIVVTK